MMGAMRILGAVLASVTVLLVGTPAYATGPDRGVPDWPGQQVDRWEAVYDLQPDGSANVRVEIDFNFGNKPGRGPYWSLITEQRTTDPSWNREYRITDVRASSPSGAPAKVYLEQGQFELAVRVGDENIANVSGVQTYVLEYRIHHIMNGITAADQGGQGDRGLRDEFFFNVIGDRWSTPISNVSIEVRSDAHVLEIACFAGPKGGNDPCDGAVIEDDSVTFTQARLWPGEPMTPVVAYPPGTFNTEPVLVSSNPFVRAVAISPWSLGAAGAILGGGLLLLVRALRGGARDDQFAGLTPGLAPALGGVEHVTKRSAFAPIAVQFEPPLGFRPGQLGTLIDEKADPRDVTATIVDLAVRGYLRVDEAGKAGALWKKQQDYSLVKLREADGAMVQYEVLLFEALFKSRNQVKLSELQTTFASSMASVQNELYKNVTLLGWFKKNPATARGAWAGLGMLLVVPAFFGIFWFLAMGWSILIPIALAGVGVAVLSTTGQAPARTAEGTRILTQAQGFELFLETAEGNQLRFEEGHDIFSRYLPFAVAFGVADKWAKKFEELAKQGADLPAPTWYHGAAAGSFWAHSQGFGDRMSNFASFADAAISAPTPGSSGGSGFSGGGSSGGGGGGGGGGGW
ncbi:MAG: DUF2207 domain-containing protein [Actinobacteria bacterium HGW-Actinobacteria-4]|nr:MAG: DUF2207 domain-containing protein [Actinobacteria bacterium HGW-Actinobacteria-4]